MLVGKCLAQPVLSARSRVHTHHCCAIAGLSGHQQPQAVQVAARGSGASEACESEFASVVGHVPDVLQLLEDRPVVSIQAQLNEEIRRCSAWSELGLLLAGNATTLDFVNVSTIWVRLATLHGIPEAYGAQPLAGEAPVQDAGFRDFLGQLIGVTSSHLRFFGMHALANVMWAMSNADWQLEQYEPAVEQLVQDWCAAVCAQMGELRMPDISNISTAIGRLDDRWRPEFAVTFYRSVLHRQDLLYRADATTLNNLLFGISRAHRRGLIPVGPATRNLLAGCVKRLLARRSSASARLGEPWRAAQLLYNCHKLDLWIGPNAYAALMPLVEQVYTQEPSPLDRWSFSMLVGFVAAHQRLKPQHRPDITPLCAYVERRLGEGTSSQLAMLLHAFSQMQCRLEPPFWAQLFSRYLDLSGQGPGGQLQTPLPLPQPHPPPLKASLPTLAQLRASQQAQERTRPHQSQQHKQRHQRQQEEQGQEQGQEAQGEGGRTLYPRPQLRRRTLPTRVQPSPPQPSPPSQQPQPPGAGEADQEPEADAGPSALQPQTEGQLPGLESLPDTQAARLACSQAEPEATEQPVAPQSPCIVHDQLHSFRGPAEPDPGVHLGLAESQQASPVLEPDPDVRAVHLEPPGPQQESSDEPLPQAFWSQEEPADGRASEPLPMLDSHDGVEQLLSYYNGHSPPHQPLHTQHLQPESPNGLPPPPLSPSRQRQQQELDPEPQQLERRAWPKHAPQPAVDDRGDPRTLHYICWQAAKAGILPPRAFLRLYVARVPPWLEQHASDVELAQAVETLKLLRWVPRRDVRDILCRALERQAPDSALPLRKLLRWLQQQQQ